MQRNRAYSNRVKELKIKAPRERAKTVGNRNGKAKKTKSKSTKVTRRGAIPKIFNSLAPIECPSNQSKCKAFQRVVHVLKLYTTCFLAKHNDTYHEQTVLSHSTSQPVTPAQSGGYCSTPSYSPRYTPSSVSKVADSPFDIVTESNLRPSNHPKKKRSLKNKSKGHAFTPTVRAKASKSDVKPLKKMLGFTSYLVKCGAYNTIHLLNDFNHLTQHHNIYDLVKVTKDRCVCDVDQCLSMCRMYRNRVKCAKYDTFRQAQYLGFDDPNELITQQIMDRIHIYLLHTLDIGMRLDPKEFEEDKDDKDSMEYKDDALCKMNEWIVSKRAILSKLTGSNWVSKFTSIMDDSAYTRGPNQGHYSPRFYYWNVYANWDASDKNNPGYNYQQWYCEPKYDSLKHEMLSSNTNAYALMSHQQWRDLVFLCGTYQHCEAIKRIKADFEDLHGYGIQRYTPIQMHHVLSLLIYCNFESVRKRFCQTFVRIPSQEKDDHLMERHSQFAHLARLLRESVEVFGQRTLFSKAKRFYHGLDKELLFKQTYAYFNGPTSTSTSIETVLNLNKKSGVVLQLADQNDTHMNGGLRFFDTSLLSDYAYEYEMLFISSLSPLHIETIIQCNLGHNYGLFVHGLAVLYQMMKGQRYKNLMSDGKDDLYKSCAHQLIQHQLSKHCTEDEDHKEYKDLPKYIDDLLDYFFLNTTHIQMNCEHLCDTRQFELFEPLFMEDAHLQLNVLMTLFPNITDIVVEGVKGRLVFDDDAFTTILKSLSSLNYACLQQLVFKEALPRSAYELIPKYEHMFIESRWFITQAGTNLVFKQSTFDVV